MLKRIILFFLFGILVFGTNTGVQAANYEYSLDLTLLAGYAALPNGEKIGGVEFTVTGGSEGTDWTFLLGDAIPSGSGWVLDSFGGNFYSVYDDYDFSDPVGTYNPIVTSGNIINIFSDPQLNFSFPDFYDISGSYLTNGQYFSSAGFTETVIPIPSTIILLGGGLIGLVALRRRRS